MKIKQIYTSSYFGILFAAIYGLAVRIFVDNSHFKEDNDVFTITFFLITPIIISIIPIIFSKEIRQSTIKSFFFPFLSIFLFYILAFVTKLEDTLCLLILGIPYLLITGTVALLVNYFLKKQDKNNKLFSLLLLPLITLPIENSVPDKSENYKVSFSIIIDKTPQEIFPNLIEVPRLSNTDYQEGFFQLIGIPRPIESKLYNDGYNSYRIGSFTDGLELYEIITQNKKNEFVNFKIDLSKSKLRNKPTDKHILKGDYFKFQNINYTLTPLSNNQTNVELSCDYIISSKMNFYANLWAENIILDFEKRLLKGIKTNLEKK